MQQPGEALRVTMIGEKRPGCAVPLPAAGAASPGGSSAHHADH